MPSVTGASLSTIQKEAAATHTISSSVTAVGSVVCVGRPTFPISRLVSKIVQNTRYMDLLVTNELAEIYQTWDTEMISWDFPDPLSNQDHFNPLKSFFARYDLDSPFLSNFWSTLMTAGVGLCLMTASFLIQIFFEQTKYQGKLYALSQKAVLGFFNFTIVQVYGCVDDILFYFVLDVKTNPFNAAFAWASFVVAGVFICLGSLLVFFNVYVVRRYQKIKRNEKDVEDFKEKNKFWELFYSDFSDNNSWSQSFLAIMVIRSSLSSFIIAVLYGNPMIQSFTLMLTDVASIVLCIRLKPFTSIQAKLAQYYFELITLLVHLFTFLLSIQTSEDQFSEGVKNNLCTGIIYLNTALVAGCLGFMFVDIVAMIKEKSEETQGVEMKKNPSKNIGIQAFYDDKSETATLSTETGNLMSSRIQTQQQNETMMDLIWSRRNNIPRKQNQVHPVGVGGDSFHLPISRFTATAARDDNSSFTGVNLQSSSRNESMNTDNSFGFGWQMNASNMINQQMDNSMTPAVVRQKKTYRKKERKPFQL